MLKIQTAHFYECWKHYEENSLVGCHFAFRKTDSSRHAELVVGAEWQPMQPFRQRASSV